MFPFCGSPFAGQWNVWCFSTVIQITFRSLTSDISSIYNTNIINVFIISTITINAMLHAPSPCRNDPFVHTADVWLKPNTHNLPTKIITTKIAWLKLSVIFPMHMKTPALKHYIMLESNPLKSRILVRRLAVRQDWPDISSASISAVSTPILLLLCPLPHTLQYNIIVYCVILKCYMLLYHNIILHIIYDHIHLNHVVLQHVLCHVALSVPPLPHPSEDLDPTAAAHRPRFSGGILSCSEGNS